MFQTDWADFRTPSFNKLLMWGVIPLLASRTLDTGKLRLGQLLIYPDLDTGTGVGGGPVPFSLFLPMLRGNCEASSLRWGQVPLVFGGVCIP